MTSSQDAMRVLAETSRTFYIPIASLPDPLRQAVASAYLCLRAIDEVEDHPSLDRNSKAQVLHGISCQLQSQKSVDSLNHDTFAAVFDPHRHELPEVTLRISDWASHSPEAIAFRIWDVTAAMADRMAHWAAAGWLIVSEADLDQYTFGVAGAVGLLLSDLWMWFDGTQTNRTAAIGFGRGLQAVNILRNRIEDLADDKDFFPNQWQTSDMHLYAERNLRLGDAYLAALPAGPAKDFCKFPLALAHQTLDALKEGKQKLSRDQVDRIMRELGYSPA